MATADQRHEAQRSLKAMVNHRMPPYPCVVLMFSKSADITSYRLLKFSDQRSYDEARTRTVAMVRALLVVTDLNDVPRPTLDRVFSEKAHVSLTDVQVMEREALQQATFDVLRTEGVATTYEAYMEASTQTSTAPDPKNSTEAKALERKAAAEAKRVEKEKAKAESALKRADGVIGTIRGFLDSENGGTHKEVLAALVKKFPDRTEAGMASTVKIQFSRLAKSTKRDINNAKIVGRGRVYKFADKGPIPGEVESETTAAATPAAPAAPAAEAAPTTPAAPTGTPEVTTDGQVAAPAVPRKKTASK